MITNALAPISQGESDPLVREKQLDLEYMEVAGRVRQLANKFFANTSVRPSVVYMSKRYWKAVKSIVRKEQRQLTELQDGAVLEPRIEGLIISRVLGDKDYLQVGVLFDSKLGLGAPKNVVPTTVTSR